MKRLFAILLLVFVSGCDSSQTDITQPTGSGDDDGLAILSVGRDSIYWGETSWLVLNEPRNSIDGLQLYVQTHPMILDSCVAGKLYFRSKQNAESGKIRLYDTARLAGGDKRINFVPHDVKFRTVTPYPWPRTGYVNQTFFIEIQDLPLRPGEWEILIGDVHIDAAVSDPKTVHARVSPKAIDGEFRLRVFDSVYKLGPFDVLQHPEPLIGANAIKNVFMQVSEVRGKLLRTSDSITFEEDRFSKAIGVEMKQGIRATRDGDTIRLRASGAWPEAYELDLAVFEDQQGSISGRLRIIDQDTLYNTRQELEVWFRDMPWRESEGKYILQAFGPLAKDQITGVRYKDAYLDQRRELLEYFGAYSNAGLYITLEKE
jgi:hypothetical protein